MGRTDALFERIVAEYREMPGLKLTRAQAARLWCLDALECEALLEGLVTAGFLRITPTGAFVWTGVSMPARHAVVVPPTAVAARGATERHAQSA